MTPALSLALFSAALWLSLREIGRGFMIMMERF
jgi:hypothetical protein